MSTKKMKIRLAMREEGVFWNAYLALPDTMDRAKLIGSISIGAVKQDPKMREEFQALMQKVLANAIEDVTGDRPDTWDIGPAPQSERSGNS
jgi:hypothetical protein